jgi:hypothetical protein
MISPRDALASDDPGDPSVGPLILLAATMKAWERISVPRFVDFVSFCSRVI